MANWSDHSSERSYNLSGRPILAVDEFLWSYTVELDVSIDPYTIGGHVLAKLPNEIQDQILGYLPRHARINLCLVNRASFDMVQSRVAIIWQGHRGLYRQVLNRGYETEHRPVVLYVPMSAATADSVSTVVWRRDMHVTLNITDFKWALIDLLKASSKVRYIEIVGVHEFTRSILQVTRFKDCPNLKRVTVVRCPDFKLSGIMPYFKYKNSIIDMNAKTDLHFDFDVTPFESATRNFFDLARLQRFLTRLIHDKPDMLTEDTCLRRALLDGGTDGRFSTPVSLVLRLLESQWKGSVVWKRDNAERDPFLDIIQYVYPGHDVGPDSRFGQLYQCNRCLVPMYGACFPIGRKKCRTCVFTEREGGASTGVLSAFHSYTKEVNRLVSLAIKTRLDQLPLKSLRAKAEEHASTEELYPRPHPWITIGDELRPGLDVFILFPDTQDETESRTRYTYEQCPSLREVVEVLCLTDKSDEDVDMYRELEGHSASTPDQYVNLECEISENKLIDRDNIVAECPYQATVVDLPEDFEAQIEAEEASGNE